MTRIRTLYIGRGSFTVQLECGHVQHASGWHSIPRPGSSYDCPDCHAQEAQALAETCNSAANCPNCRAQQKALLAAPFTATELARLRFWQWMRLTGRAGS